jgi:glycerophosphoryl diester phosphodiesterase
MYTSAMRLNESDFFVKIAHRGASAYEPENTLASFNKAVDMNTDLIEFDLRRSQDSYLVVIHDRKVDRTTDGSGLVEHKTLSELKELDAGNGEKIPTLEEVLEMFGGKTRFAIELKENGIEDKIVKQIRKFDLVEDSFVISFNPNHLKVIKHLEPSIQTGLISFASLNPIRNAVNCGADAVAPFHRFISDNTVRRARESGLNLFTYVVNDSAKARELKGRGVQGIVTNRPDIL